MKVILIKDVPKVGRKYEIKDVADGFAQNVLLPQGKAKIATPNEVKKIEELKGRIEAERKIQLDLIRKNVKEVDQKGVVIKVKTNDKGHLFAQLHASDIVKAIKDSIGADISEDSIILSKPIKEAGDHDLNIKIGDEKAVIKLSIESL